jgi:hypothetical protein
MIGGAGSTESLLSASLFGSFDEIEWIFSRENLSSKKRAGETFKRIFKES